jgi:hypothetical protein
VPKPKGNLNNLLDGSPEAFYWLGFILCDAAYYAKDGKIKLCLSTKDELHLKKYGNFISFTGKINRFANAVSISVQDKPIVAHITSKFNIKDRKTYNPPDIPYMCENELIPFMIGYIDADGCIWKDTKKRIIIEIKQHISWKPILNKLNVRLHELFGLEVKNSVREKHNGRYCVIQWKSYDFRKRLKESIYKYNLPALDRKWNKIII